MEGIEVFGEMRTELMVLSQDRFFLHYHHQLFLHLQILWPSSFLSLFLPFPLSSSTFFFIFLHDPFQKILGLLCHRGFKQILFLQFCHSLLPCLHNQWVLFFPCPQLRINHFLLERFLFLSSLLFPLLSLDFVACYTHGLPPSFCVYPKEMDYLLLPLLCIPMWHRCQKECKYVIKLVRLKWYYSLPPCGIDIKRSYKLKTTINQDGVAEITNDDNKVIQVQVTK